MSHTIFKTLDANEAVARIAFHTNEVIAIYPISPASPMGEWADAWASQKQENIWNNTPEIIEMQSEGGAAGVIHGALQGGALSTTFTASQGLLLMLPNMYKIAGELTPAVIHVASRSLAAQALSIFGDHSDVMAARGTGFAMLSSASVQEAQDFALISQQATLNSRIPFLHFFDGFRTSHEISKVELLSVEEIRAMIPDEKVIEFRHRALTPENPVLRGTAQNPDVYFQARETVTPFYQATADHVQGAMDQLGELTGRNYKLYEYHGAEDAERVIVLMGSGCDSVHEMVDHLCKKGEKVGVLKVRLYRPFGAERLVEALPKTMKSMAVLDRSKEPGSNGEALYLDTLQAMFEFWPNSLPRIVGGRYGLSSKEFTPSMILSIYDNLTQDSPKSHFTIGINDDVSHSNLEYDSDFIIEPDDVYRAIFYGLGSDGTVGANKNTIKIIGEQTDNFAQGYFVYDSKKAGAQTISHLRFGPTRIRSPYLIQKANFVACHQPEFIGKQNMLEKIQDKGIFLLNTPFGPTEVWDTLPQVTQKEIQKKNLKFYVIDATKVAKSCGLGNRINTVMQACFFGVSGVLPRETALTEIRESIQKTYARKGDEIVKMNLNAVEQTLDQLYEVVVSEYVIGHKEIALPVLASAPTFVKEVQGAIISGKGDQLPVSAMPVDGTYPMGSSQYEKRNLSLDIPVWDSDICIQCGKCAFICPHAVIRTKVYEPELLAQAPITFKAIDTKEKAWDGLKYTIQVSPADCTGCELCVEICPVKNKNEPGRKALNMEVKAPIQSEEEKSWDFFLDLPELDRRRINNKTIRQQQIQEPLFEFSGACSGCGETPYLKLLSQLFGDRSIIANATGCSSIYGGNLPTTPWAKNNDGRGPAWSNSLFEDNAEFGLGIHLAQKQKMSMAKSLLTNLNPELNSELVQSILNNPQNDEAEIYDQRVAIKQLKETLKSSDSADAKRLLSISDDLLKTSVWIVGGDGWAYDIGFGGLDHVMASGENVNILVMDTEVYSNTGGQKSKATPKGAVAKFAMGGKPLGKKDLGLMAMSYGHVYVASVAMGAKDEHTLKAFLEAEAYDGPSIIIAYSPCVAHGIPMSETLDVQKMMVKSGQWFLYRHHPDKVLEGKNPLSLDSKAPKIGLEESMYLENRFKILKKTHPETAKDLLESAQDDVDKRWKHYQDLAKS